jgi:hypothetical protein
MSDEELHIGKVKELDIPDGLTCAQIKDILCVRGFKVSEAELVEGYIEDERLVYINGKLFEVLEDKNFEYSDVSFATKNSDGSISYVLKFYNGGTCFNEMIEEAVVKLQKKENNG